MAGPVGAIAGKTAGDIAARAFMPEALTRDELVERSFSKPLAGPATRTTPATVTLPAALAAQDSLVRPDPVTGRLQFLGVGAQ